MQESSVLDRVQADSRIKRGKGATETVVAEAERRLGVRFPLQYRAYLLRFGWLRFPHDTLYGLGDDVPAPYDVVGATEDLRSSHPEPHLANVVVLADLGNGDQFVLDMDPGEKEQRVVLLNHELGGGDILAPSFEAWLGKILDKPKMYLLSD